MQERLALHGHACLERLALEGNACHVWRCVYGAPGAGGTCLHVWNAWFRRDMHDMDHLMALILSAGWLVKHKKQKSKK